MRARGLSPRDLFDVELQLLRDQDVSRDRLRQRDRRIGLAIGAGERAAAAEPAARLALLADWARAVQKEEGQDSVGARLETATQVLGFILVTLGLATGAGAAATVLAYDGTRPVNVVHFLFVFVVVQLALVTLLAFSATIWRLRARVPVLGVLYGGLRLLVEGAVRLLERRLGAEQRASIRAARGRLRSSQAIYGDVERWLLISLGQRFGLSFNLGALATCLYLVAFSDLAFAWQTTLQWTPEGFHRAVSVLAAPWSWFYPDGLPSLEVVRASRYFRLDSTFGAGGAAPEVLGQWWRFLVLCLAVYGIAPRLALAVIARVRLRRALAGVRLDHGEIASLLDRLASPDVRSRAPLPEPGPLPRPAPAPAASAPAGDGAAAAVLWGDVPLAPEEAATLVERRFGWTTADACAAGVADTAGDDAAIARVAAGAAPIVVLAEAFEAPTREVRRFLEKLRAAVDARRPVVVAIFDTDDAGRRGPPTADDRRVWETHVRGLGDPYLRVEALVEEASVEGR